MRTEAAVTGEDIREVVAELIKAFDGSHTDQETAKAIGYWENVDHDDLRDFYVQQSVVYLRLMFLGLLLQPHDVPSRYADQDDDAPSPFDYDGFASDSAKVPGIVRCLPEIWAEIAKSTEVTQKVIAHQRTMFLE